MLAGVQSVPRVMRGLPVTYPMMWDVPLEARGLADDEIDMPEECVRPGDVLLSPGVCGPSPSQVTPGVVTVPIPTTKAPVAPAAAASSAGAGMSTTTMLLLGAGAIAGIYFLGKRK
jgi:hypothetical protein